MSRPIFRHAERPNILMIMTDQHAARVMGCAGDVSAKTPSLDALAARGARFANAYCPSPLCVPSRMAFLTGLEPHVSGVLSNDDFLPSDIPTIAHAMGAVGYDCRLIGRMHFYGPDQLHGFVSRPIGDIGPGWPGAGPPDIGDLTAARGNRGRELPGSGCGETSYQAFDHAVTDAAEVEIAELLRQRDATGRPFFAVASLFCPHPPYIALPEDWDAVDPGPAVLPPPTERHPALAAWAKAGEVDGVAADAAARSRRAYYGLVRMIDRLAGRIMHTVSERDDTIVIYASDHGEALGERGLWWKSTFYDESAKVPMIMAGPGIPEGVVDARVTGLMDLSATLLEWAGAQELPGHVGRNLLAVDTWKDRVTSSYYGGLMNIDTGAVRHRMLRRGDLKLCHYDGHAPQLFELSSDPEELHDLAPTRPDLVDELGVDLGAGWNVKSLAAAQAVNAARTQMIRQWVRTTRPPEATRWRDPVPSRNRYAD